MTGFSWPRSDSTHRERKNSTNSEMLPALSVKICPWGMRRGFKCVVIWCLPPHFCEKKWQPVTKEIKIETMSTAKRCGAIFGNKSLMIQCLFSEQGWQESEKCFFSNCDLWIKKLEHKLKPEKSHPSFIKLFNCLTSYFSLAVMTVRGKYGRRQHQFPQMQTLCSLHCNHSTINYFCPECQVALGSVAVPALFHPLQNQLHGIYV